MASVQAAASLFASDDAEDPFASLGAEPASQNHEHSPEAGYTGGAKGLVDNSASFFDEQFIAEQPSTTAGPESVGRPYTERATSYSYTPTAHNAGYHQDYQSHPSGTEQQVPAGQCLLCYSATGNELMMRFCPSPEQCTERRTTGPERPIRSLCHVLNAQLCRIHANCPYRIP